jgi:hypothetical protein
MLLSWPDAQRAVRALVWRAQQHLLPPAQRRLLPQGPDWALALLLALCLGAWVRPLQAWPLEAVAMAASSRPSLPLVAWLQCLPPVGEARQHSEARLLVVARRCAAMQLSSSKLCVYACACACALRCAVLRPAALACWSYKDLDTRHVPHSPSMPRATNAVRAAAAPRVRRRRPSPARPAATAAARCPCSVAAAAGRPGPAVCGLLAAAGVVRRRCAAAESAPAARAAGGHAGQGRQPYHRRTDRHVQRDVPPGGEGGARIKGRLMRSWLAGWHWRCQAAASAGQARPHLHSASASASMHCARA